MPQSKLLLSAVVGPYGVKDKDAEAVGCQMELLDNQVTRGQGVHSPRQAYWSFCLYLMAENLSTPTTVLDFPTWDDFTAELKRGYTHVGISFIVPNVLKAKRMAEYIRAYHPEIKIILGGYGTIIPELETMVPHDERCVGEGVRWLQRYFGEDDAAPIDHPALIGPAYEYIYGYKARTKGAILMPGVGCTNGCAFCVTSHKFNKEYVPLLATGEEMFAACRKTERETKSSGFSIMDENFLKHPVRARQLLAEMTKAGKPYVFDIFASAEVVKEMGVDFLVRLGVRMVWIGAESKHQQYEKTRGIDLRSLVQELQAKGIVVNTSAILFRDHHDDKTMQEDIDWVISLGANLTQFMNYTPYPTTSLHKRLHDQGRLTSQPYRYQHGAGELAFEHPHFKDPKQHGRLLKQAFRRKYQVEGPGILNMAITAAQGYLQAKDDMARRKREGLVYDPETGRYLKSDKAGPDRFMKRRVLMMRTIAMGLRPVLLPALVFAPNWAARKKALGAFKLFKRALGPVKKRDAVIYASILLTASGEWVRILGNHMLGREGIVRQPSCRRTEVDGAGAAVSTAPVKTVDLIVDAPLQPSEQPAASSAA